MNNKLVCPFCQQDLRKLFNRYTGEPNCDYECGNCDCDLYGIEIPETVWQALIQAKQDLEIARKALKEIDTTRCIPQQTLISLGKLSKTTRFNAGNIICVATPDYIHNTLEQINHKEDK